MNLFCSAPKSVGCCACLLTVCSCLISLIEQLSCNSDHMRLLIIAFDWFHFLSILINCNGFYAKLSFVIVYAFAGIALNSYIAFLFQLKISQSQYRIERGNFEKLMELLSYNDEGLLL